ncbi:arginine decarboxylase [Lachnospiraceae bacterium PF1-21]
MKTIRECLQSYTSTDFYPFHMPGHKRNLRMLGSELPYSLDITEIDGFDDLHHASGLLKEAQERAGAVFGAEESHFLVNGSTGGILSAIKGIADLGDTILVARNCHKSVYNGLEMFGIKAVFLYPRIDQETGICQGISPAAVREALNAHPECKGLVITSPTYEGVVSQVREIADILHQRQLPLIVDEAHGAHFGFHKDFPASSNVSGADIVIHSLHKTLPALTGTGLLHMNGEIVDKKKVARMLTKLQTSSPSYLLMASIDECVSFLQERGPEEFARYTRELQELRSELRQLKRLKLVEGPGYELSKIVISTRETSLTGTQLMAYLRREHHLELEMASGDYVVAMTSVCDCKEGFLRLLKGLLQMDERLSEKSGERENFGTPVTRVKYSISETVKKKRKNVIIEEAAGMIAAEYIYLYPPGVPLLIPGEEITQTMIQVILKYRADGLEVQGLTDTRGDLRIEVIDFG